MLSCVLSNCDLFSKCFFLQVLTVNVTSQHECVDNGHVFSAQFKVSPCELQGCDRDRKTPNPEKLGCRHLQGGLSRLDKGMIALLVHTKANPCTGKHFIIFYLRNYLFTFIYASII
jgi:hypothetical protein